MKENRFECDQMTLGLMHDGELGVDEMALPWGGCSKHTRPDRRNAGRSVVPLRLDGLASSPQESDNLGSGTHFAALNLNEADDEKTC